MTRGARLLVVGSLAATLLVVVVAPASGHAPTGAWTEPTPEEGARVDALPDVHGVADHDGGPTDIGIQSVTITITDAKGEPIPEGVRTVDGAGQEHVEFSWPGDELPIVANGTYTFLAQVTAASSQLPPHPGATTTVPPRSFLVSVPPATPTGLRATATGGGSQVSLVWNANTEPDLLGYAIERRAGDGAYTEIKRLGPKQANDGGGKAGLAGYVDRPTAAGDYTYRVVAVRCAGVFAPEGYCGEASNSNKSSPASVAYAPPVTTTTTQAAASTPTTVASGQPSRGVDLSRFGALRSQARRSTPRPTEPDTGYSELLPFGARPERDDDVEREPGGDQAAFTEDVLGASADDERRALLIPVAIALILFVCAMQLRWLTHRIAEPLPAVWPASAGEQLVLPGFAQVSAAGHRRWRQFLTWAQTRMAPRELDPVEPERSAASGEHGA